MVHLFLRKKDGTFAARQDVRLKWPGPDRSGPFGGFGRAVTNPHLLDWNRDGHTDLVIGYTEGGWHDTQWTLYIGNGPLAGKTEVVVKPYALPKVADANAVYFGFGSTSPQCIGVGYVLRKDAIHAYLCTPAAQIAERDAFAKHLRGALRELAVLIA